MIGAPVPLARRGLSLANDKSGVSLVEFALALPLLLGVTMSGLEMANYLIAASTCQRLASLVSNIVSQSGVGDSAANETQLYDLFYSLDVSAAPLDFRKNGRVIFTVIKGTNANGVGYNEYADAIYSQQFDGDYVKAVPVVGCHSDVARPVFNRVLPNGELMAHAQVSYHYVPLFSSSAFRWFSIPQLITRTATYRLRKNQFQISNDDKHPAKSNCLTVDGLN